uniref:Uncharacterized protein n=1 Tax=Bionectria ochroleuca TaxID=29856 RepID=A0A8H7NMY3_BIOOC
MPQYQRHQPLNWSGYTFVNLSHLDDIRKRDIQNCIHSHVMPGAGRLRRKKPRHVVIRLEIMAPEANNGGFQHGERPVHGPTYSRVGIRVYKSSPPQDMGPYGLLWSYCLVSFHGHYVAALGSQQQHPYTQNYRQHGSYEILHQGP